MGFCTCHWLIPYPTTQIVSPEYPVFLWTVGTTLSLKLELWSYPSSYLLRSGSYWQTVIIPGCQMYFLTLSVVSPSSGCCLLTALLCWYNWSLPILLPPTISHLEPLKTDLTIHSVDFHDNQIGLPIIFGRAFKSPADHVGWSPHLLCAYLHNSIVLATSLSFPNIPAQLANNCLLMYSLTRFPRKQFVRNGSLEHIW